MEKQECGYMFDTVIFNKFADGELWLRDIGHRRVIATHVQHDELSNTERTDRKNLLLAAFESVAPESLPTSSAVWDLSKWDKARWPSPGSIYNKLLAQIQLLDKKAKKKSHPGNQERDALIAETAIKERLVLVTNDASLGYAARAFGCKVITLEEFRRG
ncbi:MAG: hypothetical protein WA884_18130 [Methyloceanibacter sp.]|jgi:hypothetical protein